MVGDCLPLISSNDIAILIEICWVHPTEVVIEVGSSDVAFYRIILKSTEAIVKSIQLLFSCNLVRGLNVAIKCGFDLKICFLSVESEIIGEDVFCCRLNEEVEDRFAHPFPTLRIINLFVCLSDSIERIE